MATSHDSVGMEEGMIGGAAPAGREHPSSILEAERCRKGLQAQRYFIPAFPVGQEAIWKSAQE